ncbi:hypothetical protein HMPREF0774_2048 [Staphylococcus aureus subsp. aureus TCH130]|nr:hypothetical protein HMPREF0774_2048 [Staphylococcus aureus subsp. aureus TCH130]
MMATDSPRWMARSTPARARVDPKFLLRAWASITGMFMIPASPSRPARSSPGRMTVRARRHPGE